MLFVLMISGAILLSKPQVFPLGMRITLNHCVQIFFLFYPSLQLRVVLSPSRYFDLGLLNHTAALMTFEVQLNVFCVVRRCDPLGRVGRPRSSSTNLKVSGVWR